MSSADFNYNLDQILAFERQLIEIEKKLAASPGLGKEYEESARQISMVLQVSRFILEKNGGSIDCSPASGGVSKLADQNKRSLQIFEKERILEKTFRSKVVLVIKPEYDPNHATEVVEPIILQLEHAGFRIITKKVRYLGEIAYAVHRLKKQANTIHALYFSLHGDPKGIYFSESDEKAASAAKKNNNVSAARAITSQLEILDYIACITAHLEPNAPLIMNACSTKKQQGSKESIAQIVAKACNHIVYAPDFDSDAFSPKLISTDPIAVTFVHK